MGYRKLTFSFSVLAGGAAFDWLKEDFAVSTVSGIVLDPFALVFAVGCGLKSLGVLLAARVREPK